MKSPGASGGDPDGDAVIALRVKPHAQRAGLVGWHGQALKLAVRAAPERGRANDEVLAVLAAALGVPTAALVLEAGAASRDKRVRVRGLTASEARRRLEAALAQADPEAKPGERDA